jgi:hypothetical protein
MRLATAFTLIFSIFFWACQPEPKKPDWDPTTTQLLCEDLTVEPSSPVYAVYLRVGERKTKIAEINSSCNNLAAEELATYEMPAEVLGAIGGWWAGSGDYIYAVLENNEVVVYQGSADEMQEAPGYNYRRIVSYNGKEFKLEPAN